MQTQAFDVATAQYVSLATYRRSGVEVRTPVSIAGRGAHHYVFSAGDAGKVKRIRANSHVRITRCNVRGVVSSGWIDARAEIVRDPAVIRDAYRACRSKYGLRIGVADLFSKLTGRYAQRAMLHIELNDPSARAASEPTASG